MSQTLPRGQYERQQGGVDRGEAGAGEGPGQPGEGPQVGAAHRDDHLGLTSSHQSLQGGVDHLAVLNICRVSQSIEKHFGRAQLNLGERCSVVSSEGVEY